MTTEASATKRLFFPKSYKPTLDLRETEGAIRFIKDRFQKDLAKKLNLTRVSAPIIVQKDSGVNDYLSGKEIPVQFQIDDMNQTGEIVQSLAKWKRQALADYRFKIGEGLYTDMNAIRPHEALDNLHSLYVDQWDWERIIAKKDRELAMLKSVVTDIYKVIRQTEKVVCAKYPKLKAPYLPEKITFVHSEALQAEYPDLTPREREDAVCKKFGAVFVIGIGGVLADGKQHDDRASDYDDWSTPTSGGCGLNGDILVWNPVLNTAFELSSMGIRVNEESLVRQLEIKKESFKLQMNYHKRLMAGELPQTLGGGIGQSRLCMLYLRKAHVGEVQSSIWPKEMIETCRANKIPLL